MICLSLDEVKSIYKALVIHFNEQGQPILPEGVKNSSALETAVQRQHTGHGYTLKYPEPWSNAASLTYGLCMGHPFHNGNKRTSLVTLLVHLERNGLVPKATLTHNTIYNLMLYLAAHHLTSARMRLEGGQEAVAKLGPPVNRLHADEEVAILAEWIRANFQKEDKREHPLTFRQLRRILAENNCYFGDPNQNFIDIYRDEDVQETGFLGLGRKRIVKKRQRLFQLSYAGDGELVRVPTIRQIRKACRLMPEDGVDSRVFYEGQSRADTIINQYRNVLNRLAKV